MKIDQSLRRVYENRLICELGHCRVAILHVHTSGGDSTFCLFDHESPLSRSRQRSTGGLSIEVLL